jgi:hypothetical protein
VHQIIWKIVTGADPDELIDHVDGNGLNNKWSNLRQASWSQNMCNRRLNKNNRSGYKGVSWHRQTSSWRAEIDLNKKCHFLGLFKTAEDAGAAVLAARPLLHAEFARTN